MSFLETVEKARAFLERNGRVSLRALQRDLHLDDGALAELIEELVEIQRVAWRDGRALAWAGATPPAPTEAPEPEHAPGDAGNRRLPYTPKHLADKILQSKSALEGERKQVTVLFADVKSSMELAEELDPEEWHGILDRFFQILTDGVHRFEGTVNQYTGDGIMALFGAPIAHEDHAQRACYAALHLADELRRYADELRRTRGLSFSVRMGLNSGEVVVGKIGDDLRMDYTARGHTVGLAARMEQLAEPGRAYLTRHCADLVGGFFQLRDLGSFELKGAGEPLRVYELEGLGPMQTRLEVSRSRGFSKFVGRSDELATLEASLERALAGDGQVVGVVADAGVGKSRLGFEFAERCRARGIPVLEAHAVAHGRMIPFLPLLQLLRSFFQIAQTDTEEAARRKIAGALLLLDKEFDEALPLLFEFLGVPDPERRPPRMDPEARQRALFAVVRRILQAQSSREPGVILIEDLHWIDGGSEAFLASLVESLTGIPTLLLVNFRPEYHAPWMQKSYYHQLPLLPLGAEAIRELLDDLLGPDPSLEGFADLIHARTGGNPFFTEEVVQSLVEGGDLEGSRGGYRLVARVEELVVPASVQAVLAARIDRLAEREKQVLQTASVIGKKFGEAVLQRIVNLPETDLSEALHQLIGAEFIYEEGLYPEVEYAFKHPLTREVAYHSQLGERRARVHEAVARATEKLQGDRRGENAALVAHHWESAGNALEAARWHRRAAIWATLRTPAESMRHWRKVRSMLAGLPESPQTIRWGAIACSQLLNLGWRQGGVKEEADALFREGKALAERSRDLGILALLHGAYATVIGFSGNVEDGLRHATEASELAEQTGSEVLQVAALVMLAVPVAASGDLTRALAIGERALALTRDDPSVAADILNFSPYVFLTALRGAGLIQVGRLAEGAESLRRGLHLAREHGDPIVEALASVWHVGLAYYSGEFSGVAAHGRAGVEVAERLGSAGVLVDAYQELGWALLLEENWDEAKGVVEHTLTLHREASVGLQHECETLALLARVQAARGEGLVARTTAAEAVAAAQERKTLSSEIHAQLGLAQVLLAEGDPDHSAAIASALDRAAECVRICGARSSLPLIGVERAKLARLVGDEAGRARELREAHRLFTEIGATGHAERVARELGS